ncbi:MAG: hypothetical protein IJF78_04600 [Clostridia bacterium]|nr:hypothetical protein [Clostridia bacterium]
MKKITSLILAALILVSCTPDKTPGETRDTAEKTAREETVYDMSHVQLREIRGYMSASLPHTAQIAEFRDDGETFLSTTAPMICISGDKIYVLRRYPAEAVAAGKDAVMQFEIGATAADYSNVIEVYTGHNYDAEPELIPLTGHADKMLRLDNFEYLPDSGTFLAVQFNYHISLPKVLTAYTFDSTGKLLDSTEFAPGHYAYSILTKKTLLNGSLYYPYGSSDQYSPAGSALYRYDIESGEETMAAQKIHGFTPQDGKMLYITSSMNDEFENVFSLMEYDPVTGKTAKLGELAFASQKNLITANSWFTFAYDYDSSMLYFAQNSSNDSIPVGIRANHLGDEKLSQVLVSTEDDQRMAEIRLTDGYLTVQAGNNQVEIYSLPETVVSIDEAMEPLRFCLSNTSSIMGYRSDVFRLMEMSGYPARPEAGYLCTDPDEYANTMAKKLLAGDTDFDIFMITTEMYGLMKEGYLESLGGYSLLNDYYDRMIPGMKKLCSVGTTAALIPVDLRLSALRVNGSLTDLPAEMPKTFPELTALSSSLSLSGNARFMAEYNLFNMTAPWFEQIASNCIMGDMDDEQVKEDLIRLYEISRTLSSDSCAFGSDYQDCKPVFDIVNSSGRNTRLAENCFLLPVLPMTDAYGQVVEGSFYAVNPNSPNKELAAVFLAAHLYHAEKDYAQYFDKWDDNVFYAAGSEQTYELYKSQIASAVLYYDTDELNYMIRTHLDGIVSGTVTPEAAADELFRHLKMIKYE